MEKLQTKLFEAATQNSITSLQHLLKDDPLILDRAVVNPFNETPLHVAAMLGHVHFVQEMIRLKPELVNELNSQLSSPLHLAAAKGHVGVVKALLSADSRACLDRDRNELLPLHLAAAKGRVEAMKLLLEARPDAARITTCGGESILHLCVKSYQLEPLRLLVKSVSNADFINSRDSDGNTVLHLAVADKQVETIKFLVSVGALEVNALNHEGITALDVLIRSRRDVRDSEIEKSLKNAGCFGALENDKPLHMKQEYDRPCPASSSSTPAQNNSWDGLMKQHAVWLEKKKSALMVVASLIATMAFQIGANPPGGVWQEDNCSKLQEEPKPDPHEAGTAVFITKYPHDYVYFYIANTTAFMASLSIILLLTSGLPLRRRFFMWILMVITWIAITAIALCYALMITFLTPAKEKWSVGNVIECTVYGWIILMALLLISHTIRLIVKLVKKLRKAWIMKRRRSASSAGPAGP